MEQYVGDRIHRLEKTLRRLEVGFVLVLLICVGLVTAGLMPAREKIVEAQRFILKDNDGNVRVILGDWYELPAPKPGSNQYPMLELTGIDAIGARIGLHMFAKDGTYIAGLRTSGGDYIEGATGEGGRLALLDMATDSRIDLAVGNSYTDVTLKATQLNRKERETAKTDKDLDQIRESKTAPTMESRLSLTKDRSIFTMSEKGRNRVVLGQTVLKSPTEADEHRPLSSLVLFDSDGKVIRSLP